MDVHTQLAVDFPSNPSESVNASHGNVKRGRRVRRTTVPLPLLLFLASFPRVQLKHKCTGSTGAELLDVQAHLYGERVEGWQGTAILWCVDHRRGERCHCKIRSRKTITDQITPPIGKPCANLPHRRRSARERRAAACVVDRVAAPDERPYSLHYQGGDESLESRDAAREARAQKERCTEQVAICPAPHMWAELSVRVTFDLDNPGAQSLFGWVQLQAALLRGDPLKDRSRVGDHSRPDHENGYRRAADASGMQPVNERQVGLLAILDSTAIQCPPCFLAEVA